MVIKKFMIAGLVALTALSVSTNAEAFGVSIGPFELQLEAGMDSSHRLGIWEEPICSAIANRHLLEISTEWAEHSSNTETKIITKTITMEPYLFGRNAKGQPILRGNIVSEKVVREVTIKENMDKDSKEPPHKFHPLSDKKANEEEKDGNVRSVNLRKITEIHVIEGSKFNAPKNFDAIFKKDVVETVCVVRIAPKE